MLFLFGASIVFAVILSMWWGMTWSVVTITTILLFGLLLSIGCGLAKQSNAWRYVLAGALMSLVGSWSAQALSDAKQERQIVKHSASIDVQVVGISEGVGEDWQQVVKPVQMTRQDDHSLWLLRLPFHPAKSLVRQAEQMQSGEVWRVQLVVEPIHGQMSVRAFDQERWLLTRGITATATLMSATPVHSASPATLWDDIQHHRQHIRQQFLQLQSPTVGVLLALLTGDRALISSADRARYQDVGLSHLLAISGPHVLLMATLGVWLWGVVLRQFPKLFLLMPRHDWNLPIWLGLALGYAVLAGWDIPAQRTVYLLVCMSLLPRLGLLWAWPTVVMLLAAIMLLFDPFQILSASFVLTFLAFALVCGVVQNLQVSHVHDGASATKFQQLLKQWWQAQWRITVLLIPLVLLIFGQWSWFSLPANLLFTPLLGFGVVLINMLGWLCFWFSERAAQQIWQYNADFLQFLHQAMDAVVVQWPDLLQAWPLSGWQLAAACMIWLILLLPKGLLPRWWLLGFGCLLIFSPKDHALLKIEILDVKQGVAVLTTTPKHLLLLQDTPMSQVKHIVQPALGASSHSLGQQWIYQAQVPAQHTIQNPFDPQDSPTSPMAKGCVAGQTWQVDGVQIRALAPWSDVVTAHPSCVLLIQTPATHHVGAQHLLLLGNTDIVSVQMLLLLCVLPKIDVLLLGDQLAAKLTPAMLNQINPAQIVVSGQRNTSQITQQWAAQHHRPILNTQHQGSLVYRMDEQGVSWDNLRAHRPWSLVP